MYFDHLKLQEDVEIILSLTFFILILGQSICHNHIYFQFWNYWNFYDFDHLFDF